MKASGLRSAHPRLSGSFEAFRGVGALLELSIANTKIDCSKALELLPSMPWIGQMTRLDMANTNVQGTLPGIVIRLISEGKANFEGCGGPFTLPTDLSRINDAQKVDLSSLGEVRKESFTKGERVLHVEDKKVGVIDSGPNSAG